MSDPRPTKAPWILGAVAAAFVGVLVVAWNTPEVAHAIRDPHVLRDWLVGLGPWAPGVFVLLQVLQVVVFVLPGEVTQIAGGWIFGLTWGSVLSIIGIALGSSIAFGLTRWLGVRFVRRIAGEASLARFEHMMGSPKFIASMFLFFLIPGIPKDVLCYIAGLSRVRFVPFLALSTVARLPGILGSSLMGRALFQGDWPLLAGVALGAGALFALGWWFRDSIFQFIETFTVASPPPKTEKEDSHEPH